MSTSYNAVTWLLDRNVDEGRTSKLAFTDTVSELSYGGLQQQSRRANSSCAGRDECCGYIITCGSTDA